MIRSFYLAGVARMARVARVAHTHNNTVLRQWALDRAKEYLLLATEQRIHEVYVKNDDTNEVAIIEVGPLDCPIEGQAVIQAALDEKFGKGVWEWWDARLERGDWASSSEI